MSFSVKVDSREVDEYLEKFTPSSIRYVLTAASREAAKVMKPIVKGAAPRGPTGTSASLYGTRRSAATPPSATSWARSARAPGTATS